VRSRRSKATQRKELGKAGEHGGKRQLKKQKKGLTEGDGPGEIERGFLSRDEFGAISRKGSADRE